MGLPPENETRAPIEGGWRPSSASRAPGFCRHAVDFIIAATALVSGMVPGAAVSYPLGIISIMNRIAVSPCGFPGPAESTREGRHIVHQADLALAVARQLEKALRQFDRLCLRFHLNDREAGDQLLGLGEGPVGNGEFSFGEPDARTLRA